MPATVRQPDRGDMAEPVAIRLQAIPYLAWANRAVGAMRVWIPTVEPTAHAAD